MKKKNTFYQKGFLPLGIIIAIAVLVLGGGGLYIAKKGVPRFIAGNDAPAIHEVGNGEGNVYLFYQGEKPMDVALISFALKDSAADPVFVNVFFDVNGNGIFEGDEKGVDRVPTFLEEGVDATFPVLFANDEQFLKLRKRAETEEKVKARFVWDTMPDVGDRARSSEVMMIVEKWNIDEILNSKEEYVGGVPSDAIGEFFSIPDADASSHGEKVAVFHKGVPDLEARKGKPNECVPLSLANSLLWLAKEHSFQDKMPQTTDALLDEIGQDVKYDKDGVKNENIKSGKEEFTKRRKLPLITKQFDNDYVNGESNLWKKIASELNDGEDVELIIDFKESPRGKPSGRHAVTVVGASNERGKQWVTIHDPATPKDKAETYEIDRNGKVVGFYKKAYVNMIISESFVAETKVSTPQTESNKKPAGSEIKQQDLPVSGGAVQQKPAETGYTFAITGYVHDATAAPAMTNGTPMVGVVIRAIGPKTVTTQTRTDGLYTLSFTNAPVGTYDVCITLPSGYTINLPSGCETVIVRLSEKYVKTLELTVNGNLALHGTAINFTILRQQASNECPTDYNPFCGKDGKTYQNACFAAEARVEISYSGECITGATVTCNGYNGPMCGYDNKTYPNECAINEAHVLVQYVGECSQY